MGLEGWVTAFVTRARCWYLSEKQSDDGKLERANIGGKASTLCSWRWKRRVEQSNPVEQDIQHPVDQSHAAPHTESDVMDTILEALKQNQERDMTKVSCYGAPSEANQASVQPELVDAMNDANAHSQPDPQGLNDPANQPDEDPDLED